MSYRLFGPRLQGRHSRRLRRRLAVSYSGAAPYYDRAGSQGVSGSRDNLPQLPDGKYMPAMRLNCGEQLLRKGAEKTGRNGIPMRVAQITGKPGPHMRGPLQVPCLRQLWRRLRRRRDVQLCGLDLARGSGDRPDDAPAKLDRASYYRQHNTGKAAGVAFVNRVTRPGA